MAIRPSGGRETALFILLIFRNVKRNFLLAGLTTQISLRLLTKFGFARTRTSGKQRRPYKGCPTGKSLLIFRNRVKPQNQKYFAFPEGANHGICCVVLGPHEGRFAIVTMRWAGDVMDASASGAFCVGRKRRGVRRSRVVLAPRRWR